MLPLSNNVVDLLSLSCDTQRLLVPKCWATVSEIGEEGRGNTQTDNQISRSIPTWGCLDSMSSHCDEINGNCPVISRHINLHIFLGYSPSISPQIMEEDLSWFAAGSTLSDIVRCGIRSYLAHFSEGG
jgi:hypothetical protein